MLDCLSTIVDQFADSVGLPVMGHLEKLTSLFSRQEHYILRLRWQQRIGLSREHSRSCCTKHSLHHLVLSVAHEVYLRSLFENFTALKVAVNTV